MLVCGGDRDSRDRETEREMQTDSIAVVITFFPEGGVKVINKHFAKSAGGGFAEVLHVMGKVGMGVEGWAGRLMEGGLLHPCWSALGPLRYGHAAFCCPTHCMLSACTLHALWVHVQDSMCREKNSRCIFKSGRKTDEKLEIIGENEMDKSHLALCKGQGFIPKFKCTEVYVLMPPKNAEGYFKELYRCEHFKFETLHSVLEFKLE